MFSEEKLYTWALLGGLTLKGQDIKTPNLIKYCILDHNYQNLIELKKPSNKC
jgi:hypothetical protein